MLSGRACSWPAAYRAGSIGPPARRSTRFRVRCLAAPSPEAASYDATDSSLPLLVALLAANAASRGTWAGHERSNVRHLPWQGMLQLSTQRRYSPEVPTAVLPDHTETTPGSHRKQPAGDEARTRDPYLGKVAAQFCIRKGAKMASRRLLTPNFHSVPRWSHGLPALITQSFHGQQIGTFNRGRSR